MERMWINQPSTNQPLHHLHGRKVIALICETRKTTRVWFTDGPVVCMEIPNFLLSKGWKEETK